MVKHHLHKCVPSAKSPHAISAAYIVLISLITWVTASGHPDEVSTDCAAAEREGTGNTCSYVNKYSANDFGRKPSVEQCKEIVHRFVDEQRQLDSADKPVRSHMN
jgi:hypothetical protein